MSVAWLKEILQIDGCAIEEMNVVFDGRVVVLPITVVATRSNIINLIESRL